MNTIKEYLESGILEQYVLGNTTEEENILITRLSSQHPEIAKEIDAITQALINHSAAGQTIDPTVKPLLMATIDYVERINNGELPEVPPVLSEMSAISDFAQWLNRSDMVLPEDFVDFYAKIIGHNEHGTTAIAWLKYGSPHETHQTEREQFLIIEGTCDITIGNEVHSLVPGNYLSIPLYVSHTVTVTSEIPCKVILQRLAA